MYNLVCKQVAVYAEMFVTGGTLIAAARGRNSVAVFVNLRLLLFCWYFRKWFQACETLRAAPGVSPWYIDPVDEWKKMVVGAC